MEPAATPQGLREWVSLCEDTGRRLSDEAPRQVRRRVSEYRAAWWFLRHRVEVRGAGPSGVALEKPGGGSKGPGESVEEPAMGVAVRLLRMCRSCCCRRHFPCVMSLGEYEGRFVLG